jgi:hypothetical protein
MKRILTSILCMSMVFSSLVITPVNAENSGTQTVSETLVYSENFEEWTTDNLLGKATAIDGKAGYYSATAAEGKTVNMYSAKACNESVASMVGAVDATTEGVSDADHSGKVLKYVNNDGASDFIIVRLGSDASADLDGKITVLEYDMYLPSGKDKSIPDVGLPSLSADKDTYNTYAWAVNSLLINNSAKFSGGGSCIWAQRDNPAKFAVYNALNSGFDMGSWHKIKVVYTNGKAPSKDAPDTWRVYCDGNLVQGKLLADSGRTVVTEDVYDYLPRSYQYGPGSNKAADATDDSKNSFRGMSFQNEFLGLEFGSKGLATGTAKAIYYDNISIKTIDKTFDIDNIECNKTSFNAGSDTIKVSFTTPVDETKLSEILIKNADNVIENAVNTVELSNDGRVLTMTINPTVISSKQTYTVNFPATFTDVYGQGLLRYYSVPRSDDNAKNTGFYNKDIPSSSQLTALEFTTAESLDCSIEPDLVENYDRGENRIVELTFASPLDLDENEDIASKFSVVDETGKNILGLSGEISADKRQITLQLSGLEITAGTYKITSISGALKDKDGIRANVLITVKTTDFKLTSNKTVINDYVIGSDEILILNSTSPIDENIDITSAFSVTDGAGKEVYGLFAELGNDNKTITLQLSGIKMGKGSHKIFANNTLRDKYGRMCEWSAIINIKQFAAEYNSEEIHYAIGSEKKLEIYFSLPLSDETIYNISNAFEVTNQYGNKINGLAITVLDDRKTLMLDLSRLDITGGKYLLESVAGQIVAENTESLSDIIRISIVTSDSIIEDDDKEIDPMTGSDFVNAQQSLNLLSDGFEEYELDTDLLNESDSNWKIIKNNSDIFVDDEVIVTHDPQNSDNKVLKIAAGNADETGALASNGYNYNTVVRKFDDLDEYQLNESDILRLSLSARIYIPSDTVRGLPINALLSSDPSAYGKDQGYWLTYVSDDTGYIGGSMYSQIMRTSANKPVSTFAFYGDMLDQTTKKSYGFEISSDTWHTLELRYRFVKQNDAQYKLGYEVYLDGTKKFADNSTTGVIPAKELLMKGMAMRIVATKVLGVNPVVYYDDLKANVSSKLLTHINVAKNDVPVESPLILSFRNKIADYDALVSSVELLDSYGSVVDCDVLDVSADDTVTQMRLIPKNGKLRWDSKYTIKIKAGAKDIFGQSLNDTVYSFRTQKSDGIYFDDENSTVAFENIGDKQKATYTLKLSENTEECLIAVFAAYSKNDTLIGLDVKNIDIGSDMQNLEIVSEYDAPVFYRVYLYEMNDSGNIGRMLQRPLELSTK